MVDPVDNWGPRTRSGCTGPLLELILVVLAILLVLVLDVLVPVLDTAFLDVLIDCGEVKPT